MTALEGGCLCGGVRFRVAERPNDATYCHCEHCRRRTGTAFSLSAGVPTSGFEVLQGEELIRSFQPPGGSPKAFCSNCGGHLYAGDRQSDSIHVRFGAFDEDPGVRPSRHQFVDSAAPWDTIPDDGLPRYPGRRPGD